MNETRAYIDGDNLFILAPAFWVFSSYVWQRLAHDLGPSGPAGELLIEPVDDWLMRVRIQVDPVLSRELVEAVLHTYGIELAIE